MQIIIFAIVLLFLLFSNSIECVDDVKHEKDDKLNSSQSEQVDKVKNKRVF